MAVLGVVFFFAFGLFLIAVGVDRRLFQMVVAGPRYDGERYRGRFGSSMRIVVAVIGLVLTLIGVGLLAAAF